MMTVRLLEVAVGWAARAIGGETLACVSLSREVPGCFLLVMLGLVVVHGCYGIPQQLNEDRAVDGVGWSVDRA